MPGDGLLVSPGITGHNHSAYEVARCGARVTQERTLIRPTALSCEGGSEIDMNVKLLSLSHSAPTR